MSLPLIVDVAIGLVFIYLILSLLASEIQELLTTLLQWRAKHLKESIEMLLSGNVDESALPEEIEKTRQLANQLYNHPLISSLNYHKRGPLAMALRNVVQVFTFGASQVPGEQQSGPSYIPAGTFASTVLDMLQVNRIVRELHQDQLLKYEQQLIQVGDAYWAAVKTQLQTEATLEQSLTAEKDRLLKIVHSIVQDFQQGHTPLEFAFSKIHQELQTYLDNHFALVDSLPQGGPREALAIFLERMQQTQEEIYLEDDLDPQTQQPIGRKRGKWLSRDAVTVPQVIAAYRELKDATTNPDSPIFQKLDQLNGAIHEKIKNLPVPEKHIKAQNALELLETVPDNLLNSLAVIANKTQSTVANVEDQLAHLGQEVSHWFDTGMERAGGVYKRNAKGVAFLIGLFLAIVANVDTFFVATQLSQDTVLRQALVGQAEQIDTLEKAQAIKGDFDSLGLELPIGWGQTVLDDQAAVRDRWSWLGWPKQMLGWVVSGIAISMGAPFWFDLLGRLVNVRNTGRRNDKPGEKG